MGQAGSDVSTGPAVETRDAPPREIRPFNVLRGAAALSVAAFHAPMLFGLAKLLPHAYLAVDLFFVLSGFVMAHVYGPRIRGGMSFPRFGQLRLARLYPLLVVGTAGGVGFWLLRVAMHKTALTGGGLLDVPLNLIFVPVNGAPIAGAPVAYPFVSQSWSITWELAMCAMFWAWRRWGGRGAAAIAVGAAFPLALTVVSRGTIDGGWTYDTFWVGAVRALFAFWAGVSVQRIARDFEGRPTPAGLGWAAAASMGGVAIYAGFVGTTLWPVELAASLVVFPLLVFAVSRTRAPLLTNRVGDALGDASYSIYLLHGVSIDLVATAAKLAHVPAAAMPVVGLAWLALLVPACWLSWRYLETPLRRRLSDPALLATPLRARLRRIGLAPAA